MANNPHIRAALTQAAFEMTPPLVQETLIEDADFREEYGFKADAVLSFDDTGVSIQRSVLLGAVRDLLAERKQFDVADTEGRKWRIRKTSGEGGLPRLTMARAKQRFALPDFCALSPNRETRLLSLATAAADVFLPGSASDCWRGVLSKRALQDDELEAYRSDFHDTPVHIARVIRSEIQANNGSVRTLVPPSRRYFERLIGVYDGSTSLRDYASACAKDHLRQLAGRAPYEGFLIGLFLSSHASLTAELPIEQLKPDELVCAFDFLDRHGDRLSQLGAIEVGFRMLPSTPAIVPFLERLAGQIRDDDVQKPGSGFTLFSHLYILVSGELSRRRIFVSEPPFYRKLAVLSQAALIHRQLAQAAIDHEKFSKWAVELSGPRAYVQSLADMRLEPHHSPGLIAPSLMKAHFFARIMQSAECQKQNINSTALAALVLGKEPGSLHALSDSFRPYFPGPLDGAGETKGQLPPVLMDAIKVQLTDEDVRPSSFIALANCVQIYGIGQEQAELASKALKRCEYRLTHVKDRSQLVNVLDGLALVAAVARNQQLADSLRISVRRHRHATNYSLSIDEAIRICVVSAASHTDLSDWADFVGDCLTEMAFGKLDGADGEELYAHLQLLRHAVPELWVTCGRAVASLIAYNHQ